MSKHFWLSLVTRSVTNKERDRKVNLRGKWLCLKGGPFEMECPIFIHQPLKICHKYSPVRIAPSFVYAPIGFLSSRGAHVTLCCCLSTCLLFLGTLGFLMDHLCEVQLSVQYLEKSMNPVLNAQWINEQSCTKVSCTQRMDSSPVPPCILSIQHNS